MKYKKAINPWTNGYIGLRLDYGNISLTSGARKMFADGKIIAVQYDKTTGRIRIALDKHGQHMVSTGGHIAAADIRRGMTWGKYMYEKKNGAWRVFKLRE